jgi:hypothetical protein
VYENKAQASDQEVVKLSKYYLAHVTIIVMQKRYLSMLSYQDLIKYRIVWGFDRQPNQIEYLIR